MALLDSTAAGIVLPEVVGPLIIQPLRNRSTAMQVASQVETLSPTFRFPVVNLDAASGWIAEGSDIGPTDPNIQECIVTPLKLGALVKVSNELANDSSPMATTVVGDGLTRSIARQLDKAFFANTTPLGPNGLLSVSGISTVTGTMNNFDWAIQAQSALERVGSTVTAFCASFATVEQLGLVKSFTGSAANSNEPLLVASDQDGGASAPTPRSIFGVPLWSLPEGTISDGVVWALDNQKTFVVIRSDVALLVDPHFYFGSDCLAVRTLLRAGFGFPHPAAICQITLSGFSGSY
jgi:HK97 family phage major capsid protein